LSSSKEAETIALNYLEKNNYSEIELKGISDKIFKWEVSFSANSKKGVVEISKTGSVIGFSID
jgi:hypothetical protein